MVAFRGEGSVVVAQPVHHGAAGDDDGSKQGADAVLEGWKLDIENQPLEIQSGRGMYTDAC